jgi:predicted TIM-barrel fold metal-dependent hydrolase
MRTLAALTLLSLLAGSVRAQATADSGLLGYIKSVKAIDNHAHPVSADPADRDFDALPIDGFPPFAMPARLRGMNPELVDAWHDMYGYPYRDMTDAHLAELKALKTRTRAAQGDRYPAWVLDRLGVDVQLANRMAFGPGISAPRFRWVSFVDPLLFPLDTKSLETTPDRADLYPRTARNLARYLTDLHVKALPGTFQGYLDQVVRPTMERMAAGGAVAVKYEAAYLRRLDFQPATFEQARAVYERYRTGGAPPMSAYKPLQDYLFRYIGAQAGRLRMAVHIHSADGAGGYFEASGADPILLESALSDPALRQTNFVIVHGGWPHVRNTMSLFSRPNVYADFSFMGNQLSSHVLAEVLREWLSEFPERILFGTDAYADSDIVGWEEWGWLGATAGRKALAIALTGMMRDGEITRERAEEIARMVLRDNAAGLYGIAPGK